MGYRFRQHYTRDEARALLPQLRAWLEQFQRWRAEAAEYEQEVAALFKTGVDAGGAAPDLMLKATVQMQQILKEFERREIQIKDLDRGLIDFPALMGGKEVFLCWEMEEEDVGYWHDLESGYEGREKLE